MMQSCVAILGSCFCTVHVHGGSDIVILITKQPDPWENIDSVGVLSLSLSLSLLRKTRPHTFSYIFSSQLNRIGIWKIYLLFRTRDNKKHHAISLIPKQTTLFIQSKKSVRAITDLIWLTYWTASH